MFLKHILGFNNHKERLLQHPVTFLHEVLRAYLVRFPFQNLSPFGRFNVQDRVPPNYRELLQYTFLGTGGLCGHNNIFLKLQFESLGYQVTQLQGSFNRTLVPLSHNLFSTKIGSETYIIDAGCGEPLHEPIPISQLPFRRRAAGLDYVYKRISDNVIARINECGDAILGKKPPDFESPQNYTITLKPVTFADCKDPIGRVYSNPKSTKLHVAPYCFRYLNIEEDDFKAVCICGTELIIMTKETRESQVFNSLAEIEPKIVEYFPMIPKEHISASLRNFSEALKKVPAS